MLRGTARTVRRDRVVLSKGKGAGRPTISVGSMLRIHFLQHWFYLSNIAVEEACN